MSRIPTFTDEEYASFAEAIEDGSYFKEGRRWYSVVYMSVMAERCLYIVLTAISGATAIFALLSLLQLLPVKPTMPMLFPMKNVVRDMPIITELRYSPRQPVNDALQRYFLNAYVVKRENYEFDKVQSRFRFLKRYSSDEVMSAYRRFIDPASPRSPINKYEKKSERKIEITNIAIRREDGQEIDWEEDARFIAEVDFIGRVHHAFDTELSNWQAQVVFDYTQLKMIQPEDEKNGKMTVEPMEFTVVDYTVIEIMPQTTN